jgi:hypothetical protein
MEGEEVGHGISRQAISSTVLRLTDHTRVIFHKRNEEKRDVRVTDRLLEPYGYHRCILPNEKEEAERNALVVQRLQEYAKKLALLHLEEEDKFEKKGLKTRLDEVHRAIIDVRTYFR